MHVVARTWLSDDMRHDDQTPLIDDGSPGDRTSGQLEWDQNKGSFLSTVSAIQVPRHMARNPTFNKYVLVYGRRAEYEGNEDRRRLVRASETDDFKIMMVRVTTVGSVLPVADSGRSGDHGVL
jgi:hypothetical protein